MNINSLDSLIKFHKVITTSVGYDIFLSQNRQNGVSGLYRWCSAPFRHVLCKHDYVYMTTFSALLAICAGNSPASGEFPTQRPVTRSFDVFFDLCLDKRLSKQSWGWSFETPSCSLWRHSNVYILILTSHDLSDLIDMCMKFIWFKAIVIWKFTLFIAWNKHARVNASQIWFYIYIYIYTNYPKYSMQSMVMTFPGAGHASLAP